MREILFRGKRVDNGEWVYGAYGILGKYTDIEKHAIMVSALNCKTTIPHFYFEDIEVIPETVGQYTGLDDKNGKKIFEGDIVEYVHEYIQPDLVEKRITDVTFKNGCFWINWETVDSVEITKLLGNIYDNPELMGEK